MAGNILPSILPPSTTSGFAGPPLQITITNVSVPSAAQQASPLPTNTPLVAVVIPNPEGSPPNQITLQLSNGTQLTATLPNSTPSPPAGTAIQLPAQTPQTAATPLPNTPLLARTLPSYAPPTQAAAVQNVQAQSVSSPPHTPAIALPLVFPNRLQPSPASIPTSVTPSISSSYSLPPGPLPTTFTNTIPFSITTPLGGTLTAQSTTTATLALPNQPPQTLAIPVSFPLPLRQPIPVAVLPNPTNPNQPLVVSLPENTPIQAQTPSTPAPAQSIVILTNHSSTPVPTHTPLAGRVLGPAIMAQTQNNNSPTTLPTTIQQPVLLASGHQAILQWPSSQQPLPTGSTIVVEFPTLAGPAQVVRTQPVGPQSQHPQSSANPQTAGPITAQTAQAVLPAGTVIQGYISGQTQQGAPVLTIQQPVSLANQTLTLSPSSITQSGQLTAEGPFLPVGTQLTIKVDSSNNGNLPTLSVIGFSLPTSAQKAHTLTHLGKTWEGLQQGLSLLENQAPSLAKSLKEKLPQVENLLPGLLSFSHALQTQQPEEALGKDIVNLLKSLGVDLTPDLKHLSQLQQRQEDTQWRATLFPYVEAPGEDPQQGGFFWRREKKDDPRASTATRFILQLNLSHMGQVQLDGLITYPDVWLKLRRTTPPEADFINGLQQLVTSTLKSFGLSGGISIEYTENFPINPLQELIAQAPNPLPTSA